MPSYEIRYLNSEGELALIHTTRHDDDEAVGRAAFRMLVGSGFADYEIWRDDDADGASNRGARRHMLKSTFRAV